eukprot:3355676-Amphidinium_carterae.1
MHIIEYYQGTSLECTAHADVFIVNFQQQGFAVSDGVNLCSLKWYLVDLSSGQGKMDTAHLRLLVPCSGDATTYS